MSDDLELLRRYANDHSEEAFTELVQRNVTLVFSAAIRRLNGDSHAAQDVAQIVFTDLARNAAALRNHPNLSGWLFTSAHFAATKLVRTEARRRNREQEAQVMEESKSAPHAARDWEQLRPLIDDTMLGLDQSDREAILLRFFQGRKLAEVGRSLGINEDAARMRIDRALERMRRSLMKHQVTSTATALSVALAENCAVAAPVGLATSVTTTALTSAALAAAGKGTVSTLFLMSMNKSILGLTSALAAAGLIGFVVQKQANTRLQGELNGLREQVHDLAILRTDNERLTTAARSAESALENFRGEHTELVRARDEIASLRKSGEPLTGNSNTSQGNAKLPTRLPSEAWKNAGMETPTATYETGMWAHREADVDALAKTFTFRAAEKAKVDALFATLSPEAQAKYGSPEKMIALIFAAGEAPAAFQVLSETPQDENTMIAHVQVQNNSGRVSDAHILFSRSPNGWQMVVPANEVATQIRKITGEPPPNN